MRFYRRRSITTTALVALCSNETKKNWRRETLNALLTAIILQLINFIAAFFLSLFISFSKKENKCTISSEFNSNAHTFRADFGQQNEL